jgi:hypothetical protein
MTAILSDRQLRDLIDYLDYVHHAHRAAINVGLFDGMGSAQRGLVFDILGALNDAATYLVELRERNHASNLHTTGARRRKSRRHHS